MLLTQPHGAQLINEELHIHNTQVYSFFDTCTSVSSSYVQFYIIWKKSPFLGQGLCILGQDKYISQGPCPTGLAGLKC